MEREKRSRIGSGSLSEHGLRHQISVFCGVTQCQNGFLFIFVNESAFQKTHSHDEQGNMVTSLCGAFQICQIHSAFEPGKIDACKLVLGFCVTGKGCVAEMFCPLGSAPLSECCSPGVKFILWSSVHYF